MGVTFTFVELCRSLEEDIMKRVAVCGVVLFWLLIVCADDVAADPDFKVVAVNCPEDSINEALVDRTKELVVEISGICHEDVLVTRDRVTLRGVGTEPTIVGVETNVGVVGVLDASRVHIDALTLQGGKGNGVLILSSSFVSLSDLTIQDNASDGVQVYRSSASIEDTVVRRNGLAGIVVRWSDVALWGTIDVSHSGTHGIRLERMSRVDAMAIVRSNDNYAGYHSNYSGTATFGALEVSRNRYGVFLSNGSTLHLLTELKIVENTLFGLYARMNSAVRAAGVDCRDNGGLGFRLSGSAGELWDSVIQGNAGSDLVLQFGSSAIFLGDHDIGVMSCDETVLTQGTMGCPEPEAESSKILLHVPELPELLGKHGLAPGHGGPLIGEL